MVNKSTIENCADARLGSWPWPLETIPTTTTAGGDSPNDFDYFDFKLISTFQCPSFMSWTDSSLWLHGYLAGIAEANSVSNRSPTGRYTIEGPFGFGLDEFPRPDTKMLEEFRRRRSVWLRLNSLPVGQKTGGNVAKQLSRSMRIALLEGNGCAVSFHTCGILWSSSLLQTSMRNSSDGC